MRLKPLSLAITANGRIPRTGFTAPSSDNSPTNIVSARRVSKTCCVAARIPTAIGKSKPEPSLRRSAGARFTTTFLAVMRRCEFSKAERIRCSLSFTALSGKPTRKSPMPPPATFTSTSTFTALMPTIAPAKHFTNIAQTFFIRMLLSSSRYPR